MTPTAGYRYLRRRLAMSCVDWQAVIAKATLGQMLVVFAVFHGSQMLAREQAESVEVHVQRVDARQVDILRRLDTLEEAQRDVLSALAALGSRAAVLEDALGEIKWIGRSVAGAIFAQAAFYVWRRRDEPPPARRR